MSCIESILLGITQALTEFLPVSSSAHLTLIKHFFGEEGGVLLDLACHLGTLVALVFFLRKEIIDIILKKPEQLLLFFLALLPLPPLYLLLKPVRAWAGQIHLLGFCLMGTGLILLAGQFFSMPRSKNRGTRKKTHDALLIGALQSVALIPGISRSASTISCARILGWEAREAVRFSFLLSIPTVLGGNILELLKAGKVAGTWESIPWASLFIAFATSLLIGLLLVRKALLWLEKGNIKPCAWYCLAIGAFATLYFNL